MTTSDPNNPPRFRLLASFIAGRGVDVTEAPAGEPAHTNGRVIFVSADRSAEDRRREVVLQSALLGAGSLDRRVMKALRARPSVARRYLALEGHRVLVGLTARIPLAAGLAPDGQPTSSTVDQSLEIARGRTKVTDPPDWFGVIKPSRMLETHAGPGTPATDETHDWSSISPICPTTMTMTIPTSGAGARSCDCSTIRCSNRRPCRTIFESCSAARVLLVTALQAGRCRFAPFGGCTMSEGRPGLFPPGSISRTTPPLALPSASAAPSTRSGTYSTIGIDGIGAGSLTFR